MSFSKFDHQCMAIALRLARKGLNTTHPNPRVGCVIADGSGIVGRGWHEIAGGPHAEIAALREAGGQASGATAYITLQPCSHHGRTPPCTDALLEAGVARVVFAAQDPNPQVGLEGIERLRAAGVRVESGLMRAEAEAQNCGFLTRMRLGRPWVRVKAAQSLDGRTALDNGASKWISCEASRRDVQRWRAQSSAILTGIGTVLADDPSMNARPPSGLEPQPSRQPLRIVADSHWRTPPGSKILADPATAIVAGRAAGEVPRALKSTGVSLLPLPGKAGRIDLSALMEALAEREVNEIQVEAGASLCGALLQEQLVDEILIYQAPSLLGQGGAGAFALGPLESMDQSTHLLLLETCQTGIDLRLRLRPEYRD